MYTDRFEDVWLWDDWSGRQDSDFGIDLVAREKGTGSLCAIQCKFYDSKMLTKHDINSFLEAGSRSEFSSMMLVYSGTGYGRKAQAALAGHGCKVVNFESLADSNVYWPDLAAGLTDVAAREPHPLMDHQKDALEAEPAGLDMYAEA